MAEDAGSYARVTPEAIYTQLKAHPRWVPERDRLYRDLRFPSFLAAVAFINQVAEVAERLNHHPDMTLHHWCFLRLELSSHITGGLSQKDVDLAIAIDALNPAEVGA